MRAKEEKARRAHKSRHSSPKNRETMPPPSRILLLLLRSLSLRSQSRPKEGNFRLLYHILSARKGKTFFNYLSTEQKKLGKSSQFSSLSLALLSLEIFN